MKPCAATSPSSCVAGTMSSPTERLQAAIDKLEEWQSFGYSVMNGWLVEPIEPGPSRSTMSPPEPDVQPLTNDPVIVGLFATIDAQLAILRFGIDRAEYLVLPDELDDAPDVAKALTLADAILGEET